MMAIHLLVIGISAILAFSTLYAPQPLYPVLAEYFNVSQNDAASLTTLTMLPMSIAPFIYGYVLELFTAKRILFIFIFLLAVSQLLFALLESFFLLQVIRFVVGLLLPAIVTALLTYVSREKNELRRRQWMNYYIAFQIFGGMAGRLVSGFLSHVFFWQMSFYILAISLLLLLGGIVLLPADVTAQRKNLKLSDAKYIFGNPRIVYYYLTIAISFMVFVAILNYLPFRIRQLSPQSSEFFIGLNYVGYITGIVISIYFIALQKKMGGPSRAGLFMQLIYFFVLFVIWIPHEFAVFFAMFLIAAAMFFTHNTASGCINQLEKGYSGLTNGFYISFYYLGGTIGSLLPGFIYKSMGWIWLILILQIALLFPFALGMRFLSRAKKRQE